MSMNVLCLSLCVCVCVCVFTQFETMFKWWELMYRWLLLFVCFWVFLFVCLFCFEYLPVYIVAIKKNQTHPFPSIRKQKSAIVLNVIRLKPRFVTDVSQYQSNF